MNELGRRKVTHTTMTPKGQITIPIELRRELGLEGGERFEVVRVGSELVVRPAMSVAQRTAGMLAKYRLPVPLSIEEEREAFEVGLADEAEDYER